MWWRAFVGAAVEGESEKPQLVLEVKVLSDPSDETSEHTSGMWTRHRKYLLLADGLSGLVRLPVYSGASGICLHFMFDSGSHLTGVQLHRMFGLSSGHTSE